MKGAEWSALDIPNKSRYRSPFASGVHDFGAGHTCRSNRFAQSNGSLEQKVSNTKVNTRFAPDLPEIVANSGLKVERVTGLAVGIFKLIEARA